MGCFGWKKNSKVKNVIIGAIVSKDNVPIGQADKGRVNRILDGLSDEGRKRIAEDVNLYREEVTTNRYKSWLLANEITKRVVLHAFAQSFNVPVEQVDERKVNEIILSLSEKTIYEFATISLELGEVKA